MFNGMGEARCDGGGLPPFIEDVERELYGTLPLFTQKDPELGRLDLRRAYGWVRVRVRVRIRVIGLGLGLGLG